MVDMNQAAPDVYAVGESVAHQGKLMAFEIRPAGRHSGRTGYEAVPRPRLPAIRAAVEVQVRGVSVIETVQLFKRGVHRAILAHDKLRPERIGVVRIRNLD